MAVSVPGPKPPISRVMRTGDEHAEVYARVVRSRRGGRHGIRHDLCLRPAGRSTAAPPAGEELQTLAPVVVSATRTERSVEDLPVSATVLTREEIINSPARSIDDLLRDVAGIQLPLDSSGDLFPLQPSIAIRGIGVGDTATRVLVLVDGIPINGGFFGNVLWNRVPKDNVERIEVVRGASSSLYGSYAMGGVVNIVTRVPAQRRAGSSSRPASNRPPGQPAVRRRPGQQDRGARVQRQLLRHGRLLPASR